MYNEIGKIKNIKDIAKIYKYLKNNFQQDKTNNIEKFNRTSEEIAASKTWSGCSDIGTLLAPILRMNGIPTIYVQSAYSDWIKDLLENRDGKRRIRGHIFLEVFIEKQWVLIDFTNGYLYINYDYNDLNLPGGYFAFSKSLNGHEVGCDSLKNNASIMSSCLENFDLKRIKTPNFAEINLNTY